MRHVVMTRSAYGPAWDIDANRRRLAVTAGVTVASMAAQTNKDWTWLVAIDSADPLRAERRRVFRSAGVEVRFLTVHSEDARSLAAAAAYGAPWPALLGRRDEQLAMTRLDDDDALAPWVVASIQDHAAKQKGRAILMLPHGLRVYNGRCTVVRHDSNAMQTLVTPAGDTLHVYAYGHRDARKVAPIRRIDRRIAWVWSRHPDTISGWHAANQPLNDRLRAMFPIDWSLFGEPPMVPDRPSLVGRYFR